MKKILLMLLMFVTSVASSQTTKTPVYMGDDTYVNVPLQFPFPFYGKLFTNSFMFSNGVVSFMSVNTQPTDSFCCSGVQVNTQTPVSFHYTIMPMQTDLIPGPQSNFYIQGDSTYQKYWWENIGEFSNPNNFNSFSVEIKPTGYIGIKYDKINISNQYVTSVIIGDASKGEYNLHYYGQGMSLNSVPSLIEYQSTGSICNSNPLSDPSCPGYAEAYFSQQCSINPLYAANCPGYAIAYHDQQCSINTLYMSDCPGYQQAYFNQQCELNGLYDISCPNYAAAYATKQLLTYKSTDSSTISTKDTAVQSVTTELTSGISDSTVSTVVTNTTNSNTTNQSSPTSVTSNNSVVAPQQSLVAPITPIQSAIVSVSVPLAQTPAQQQEKQQDQKKTENAVAQVERKSGGNKKEVAKQVATVAKDAADKAKNAPTLEAQAANQGLVVGLMGYVPGFSAYQNSIVPDVNHVQMTRQYNKPNVDNRNVQRRLSGTNEIKWQEMVDSQYNKGN